MKRKTTEESLCWNSLSTTLLLTPWHWRVRSRIVCRSFKEADRNNPTWAHLNSPWIVATGNTNVHKSHVSISQTWNVFLSFTERSRKSTYNPLSYLSSILVILLQASERDSVHHFFLWEALLILIFAQNLWALFQPSMLNAGYSARLPVQNSVAQWLEGWLWTRKHRFKSLLRHEAYLVTSSQSLSAHLRQSISNWRIAMPQDERISSCPLRGKTPFIAVPGQLLVPPPLQAFIVSQTLPEFKSSYHYSRHNLYQWQVPPPLQANSPWEFENLWPKGCCEDTRTAMNSLERR